MAKFEFRGLRGLGELFGLLGPVSSPDALNIEEGVTVVYNANEAIRETSGRTYTLFAQQTLLAAATTGATDILPWDSAPAIPEAHRANSYLVNASLSASGDSGDFVRSRLSMDYGPLPFTSEVLVQNTIAGGVIFKNWLSILTGGGPIALLGLSLRPDNVITDLPWKLPEDGLRSAGNGSSLTLDTDKSAGSGSLFMNLYVQFWAGPAGVTCPWL